LPKKITNFIREGLPSKIYLLAYAQPMTGYQIGKKIYDIERGTPPTSKIYNWLTNLRKKEIVRKIEGEGYVSLAKPLAEEIIGELQNKLVFLDPFENQVLETVLDSPEFRQIIKNKISEIDFTTEVNSILLITETLGQIASSITLGKKLLFRKLKKKDIAEYYMADINDFKEAWKQNKANIENNTQKSKDLTILEEILEPILPSKDERPMILEEYRYLFPFNTIPLPLLEKLSELSPYLKYFPIMLLYLIESQKFP
jgi:hypothetical protein